MKLKLFTLALLTFLVACSQEKTHAVYDTDSNPDNFPPAAVEVLQQIEAGSLVGADAITGAFGDLLTNHSDLLDRPEWKRAVDNMGILFRTTADSLSRLGIGSYVLAAEYYQLGALARPEDSTLRRMSGLFGCWLNAKADSTLSAAALAGDFRSPELVLATTRRFMFGDTLYQQFFKTCLAPEIRKGATSAGMFSPESLAGQSLADRALLAFAGLADSAGLGTLTSFSTPRIGLIAARITQLDSASYRAELYFRPQETVPSPLKVQLRLNSDDGTAWPVEIVPQSLTTSWVPQDIALVSQIFRHSGRLASVAVGLSDFGTPQPAFLRPDGSTSDLYLLSGSDIVLM